MAEDSDPTCVQCNRRLGEHLMGRRIGVAVCPDGSGRKFEQVIE